MPIQHHDNDILPHIDTSMHRLGTPGGSDVTSNAVPLEQRSALADSCVTLFSFAGASIQVCFSISGNNINLKAVLKTPLGDITLGSATLNPSHPSVTLGGSISGFKAEVTITYDIGKSELCISGKLCAPFLGCKSGSTCIHL